MMRLSRQLACIAVLALGAGSAASAGPFDRSVVDSAAIWMVHLDVDAMRADAAGAYILHRISTAARAPLRLLEQDLGITVGGDIKGLTIYAVADDADDSVVVLTTTAALDQTGSSLQAAYPQTYRMELSPRGVPIHRWMSLGKQMHAAVHPGRRDGERLMILSDCQRNLDRGMRALGNAVSNIDAAADQNGQETSGDTRARPSVASLLPNAVPGAGSVVFGLCGDLRRSTEANPKAEILQSTRAMVFDAGREPGQNRVYVRARLIADSAESAQRVERMVQSMLMFVSVMEEQKSVRSASALASGGVSGAASGNAAPSPSAIAMSVRAVRTAVEGDDCIVTSEHDGQVVRDLVDALLERSSASKSGRQAKAAKDRGVGTSGTSATAESHTKELSGEVPAKVPASQRPEGSVPR